MKLHLPKSLISAVLVLMSSASYTFAANVADVTNTVTWKGGGNLRGNAKVVKPEYVGPDVTTLKAELTDAKVMDGTFILPVIYESAGESATIENWGSSDSAVTISSALSVRGGELTLKGCYINTKLGTYHTSGSVSGNNATLVLDGTTMKSDSSSTDIYYVGGQSGAGKLVLKGNSEMFVDTWMIVGISKYSGPQGNSGYNTSISADSSSADYKDGVYTEARCPYSDDESGEKKGAFNDYNTGHEYGTGILEVTDGSKLTLGGSIGVREGIVTVSGQGSVIETSTKYVAMPSGNNEEMSDLFARGSGSVSHVYILNGGKWHTHSWFTTSSLTSFETKTCITVDGAGSILQADKGLALGFGVGREQHDTPNVGSTEMFVTGGGKVIAGEISVGLGDKDHAGKEYARRGANPVYLYVDEDSSMETEGRFRVNKAVFGLTYDVYTEGFEVNVQNEGVIKCKEFIMDGGNFSSTGMVMVTDTFEYNGGSLTLGIGVGNQEKSAITAASYTASADGVVSVFATQNLTPGKYKIIDITGGENGDTISRATTTGGNGVQYTFANSDEYDFVWDGNDLVLLLTNQVILVRDPLADVLGNTAWGVQKSSQAFSGTLWGGGRANAVVLCSRTTSRSGAKGNVVSSTAPTHRNIAWGTAYGEFSRLSTCGEAGGANYSIYGAAVGVERQFASGRTIGAALGYDWGKVSPFSATSVDQESMHAAVYGRAGQWKTGQRGAVAVDLAAAVGCTESELPVGDADQDSLQLDARVSYIHSVSDKTSVSAFAGLQYYAQSDAATTNVEMSSVQYLRTNVGVGVNHAVTEKATVFAEARVYNDAMRHNPEVVVDGIKYDHVANPGRLGGSITAGAAYELNENWTLRGSYSFEAAKHNTEHRVNVGASYTF